MRSTHTDTFALVTSRGYREILSTDWKTFLEEDEDTSSATCYNFGSQSIAVAPRNSRCAIPLFFI